MQHYTLRLMLTTREKFAFKCVRVLSIFKSIMSYDNINRNIGSNVLVYLVSEIYLFQGYAHNYTHYIRKPPLIKMIPKSDDG